MSRFIPLLVAAFIAVFATAASATPIPDITVSDGPTVGVPVTFDATGTVCDAEPCGYTWRIIDGTRLGITFSRLPVATYTFSSAGPTLIQLRVVNSNPRIGGPSPREAIVYESITVAPASVITSTPPPQLPAPPPAASPELPAPTQPPPPPRPLAPKDISPPSFTIAVGARKLKNALAKGLRLTLSTNEGGVTAVTVTVDKRTARKLKIDRHARHRIIVGSLQTTVAAGSPTIVVRLAAHARRALKDAGKVNLLITALITDAAGNTSTRTATLRLNR